MCLEKFHILELALLFEEAACQENIMMQFLKKLTTNIYNPSFQNTKLYEHKIGTQVT